MGIDKEPHYEFLQSIASYRDVSNVFSVNSENLLDAAPYMYRDVCNSESISLYYSIISWEVLETYLWLELRGHWVFEILVAFYKSEITNFTKKTDTLLNLGKPVKSVYLGT